MRSKRSKKNRKRQRKSSVLHVSSRRKEKSRVRTQRTLAVAVLLGFLGTVIWGVMAGSQALGNVLYAENEAFQIRRIHIENPAGRLDARHIREYAGLTRDQNLFAIDLKQIRQDLLSVPMIRDVTVRRQVPDTLVIEIEERAPLARLRLPGHRYLLAVDRGGCVLGPSPQTTSLPSISGLHLKGLRPGSELSDSVLQRALESVELCNRARISRHVRIRNIDVSRSDVLDVLLRGGERVIVPVGDGLDEKFATLANILRIEASRGRKVASVDLTVNRNFPITYR